MSIQDTNSLKDAFFEGKHTKDKALSNQFKVIHKSFYNAPKTMLMASKETGILRANICRYVATLRKSKKIAEVKKGFCEVTKHKAGFLTTNPNQFPKSNQLKMF
jgi:hypothetical protein